MTPWRNDVGWSRRRGNIYRLTGPIHEVNAMTIGNVCTKGAVTVSPSAPLSEAAQLMCSKYVGTLVVTSSSGDKPVVTGVITDRDIVRAQLHRTSDLSRLSVAEIMTPHPLVLREQESVQDAINQLQARGVRRAPVVDASGVLVGLVSTDDLLAEVSDELVNLVRLIAQQSAKEEAVLLSGPVL
jgi:CBS domain-containing protein